MSKFGFSMMGAGSAGTEPGFSPDDLNNLSLWLDASDTGTISHSTGDVSTWADKSSSGYDVSYAAGTVRTGDNTINGMNTISVNAAGSLSRSGTSIEPTTGSYGDGITVYVVFKKTGTAAAGEALPILLAYSNLGRPMDRYSTSTGSRYGADVNPSALNTNILNIRTATSPVLLSVTVNRYGPAETRFSERVNGVFTDSVGSASGLSSVNQSISIGRRPDSGSTFEGDIAEILIYNEIHDSSELEETETYLMNKWGIS